MKTFGFAVLVAMLMSIVPVWAIEMRGRNAIVLTDDEVRQCNEGGGCVVATKDALDEMRKQAVMSCGSRT